MVEGAAGTSFWGGGEWPAHAPRRSQGEGRVVWTAAAARHTGRQLLSCGDISEAAQQARRGEARLKVWGRLARARRGGVEVRATGGRTRSSVCGEGASTASRGLELLALNLPF